MQVVQTTDSDHELIQIVLHSDNQTLKIVHQVEYSITLNVNQFFWGVRMSTDRHKKDNDGKSFSAFVLILHDVSISWTSFCPKHMMFALRTCSQQDLSSLGSSFSCTRNFLA